MNKAKISKKALTIISVSLFTSAALTSFSGCNTQIPKGSFSRNTTVSCFPGQCGCARALTRLIVPPTRLPTASWKNLTPFIQLNLSGQGLLHALEYPAFGLQGVDGLPQPLSTEFHFRNEWNDLITRPLDGGSFPHEIRNFYALATYLTVGLATIPTHLIDSFDPPLNNRKVWFGIFSRNGGSRLRVSQGTHVEVIGNEAFAQHKFFCSPPTNQAAAFSLSQTEPINVEFMNNFSDGGDSNITDNTDFAVALLVHLEGYGNPLADVCGKDVHKPTDTNPLPGSLPLSALAEAGWFALPAAAAQMQDVHRAYYNQPLCPMPD